LEMTLIEKRSRIPGVVSISPSAKLAQ